MEKLPLPSFQGLHFSFHCLFCSSFISGNFSLKIFLHQFLIEKDYKKSKYVILYVNSLPVQCQIGLLLLQGSLLLETFWMFCLFLVAFYWLMIIEKTAGEFLAYCVVPKESQNRVRFWLGTGQAGQIRLAWVTSTLTMPTKHLGLKKSLQNQMQENLGCFREC